MRLKNNIFAAAFDELKRNRVTEYSGNLFGSGGGIDVSLNDTWEQSFTAEW